VDSDNEVTAAGSNPTAFADYPSDPRGDGLAFHRVAPEPDAGEVATASSEILALAQVRDETSVSLRRPGVRRLVGPGDTVYRYAPDEQQAGPADVWTAEGLVRPTEHTVTEMTWSPAAGDAVVVRVPPVINRSTLAVITPARYVDVTKYLALPEKPTSVLRLSSLWMPAWAAAGAGDLNRLNILYKGPGIGYVPSPPPKVSSPEKYFATGGSLTPISVKYPDWYTGPQ